MKKQKSNSFIPCLLVLVLLCLGLSAAGAGVWWFNQKAGELYGTPAAALSVVDRTRYGTELVVRQNEILLPVNSNGQQQTFTIDVGESVNSIAYHLESAGLIRSATSFRMLLIYSGMDTGIQAGDYTLSPAMTALQIAQKLQDATPDEVTFSILAGWRLEEIAAAIPTSGLNFSAEDFLASARQTPPLSAISDSVADAPSYEGFLFPDNYRFSREVTVEEFLSTVTQNFTVKISADIQNGFSNQGLTLYQGVILASIVQREAMVEDEQPMIASVFLNRLAAGMSLDSDPTVQYAVGYNTEQSTWWTNPLSADDLKVDSPYNTYLYPGLPPGPISNPGLSALRAVAFPAKTPYYYFQAQCDDSGKHQFAETYEQHLQNSCGQ